VESSFPSGPHSTTKGILNPSRRSRQRVPPWVRWERPSSGARRRIVRTRTDWWGSLKHVELDRV